MVIAALLALQLATTAPALPAPFAELPPQVLEAGQCALFLWDRGSGKRIAMLGRTPAIFRAIIDGRSTDFRCRNSSSSRWRPGPVMGNFCKMRRPVRF